MSAGRSRWKTFTRAAGLVFVFAVALVVAPLPWPKPIVGRLEPNDDGEFALDWGLSGDPLLIDLKRGRWKAGDTVESVGRRYKYIETYTMDGFTHGEFTTWDRGEPIRTRFEVVALRGRLRAAGAVWSLVPSDGGRFETVYFDTLTKEEWAAHDASYKQAIAALHAKQP